MNGVGTRIHFYGIILWCQLINGSEPIKTFLIAILHKTFCLVLFYLVVQWVVFFSLMELNAHLISLTTQFKCNNIHFLIRRRYYTVCEWHKSSLRWAFYEKMCIENDVGTWKAHQTHMLAWKIHYFESIERLEFVAQMNCPLEFNWFASFSIDIICKINTIAWWWHTKNDTHNFIELRMSH